MMRKKIMQRTSNYHTTVRMMNGQVHPEDRATVDGLRIVVKMGNIVNDTQLYVKLQGRLGKNNSNAWKYRPRRNGGIYGRAQCVRLQDAAYADVYVYRR
jgi:hypothetical protein